MPVVVPAAALLPGAGPACRAGRSGLTRRPVRCAACTAFTAGLRELVDGFARLPEPQRGADLSTVVGVLLRARAREDGVLSGELLAAARRLAGTDAGEGEDGGKVRTEGKVRLVGLVGWGCRGPRRVRTVPGWAGR